MGFVAFFRCLPLLNLLRLGQEFCLPLLSLLLLSTSAQYNTRTGYNSLISYVYFFSAFQTNTTRTGYVLFLFLIQHFSLKPCMFQMITGSRHNISFRYGMDHLLISYLSLTYHGMYPSTHIHSPCMQIDSLAQCRMPGLQ
jgi:hypothetical protein